MWVAHIACTTALKGLHASIPVRAILSQCLQLPLKIHKQYAYLDQRAAWHGNNPPSSIKGRNNPPSSIKGHIAGLAPSKERHGRKTHQPAIDVQAHLPQMSLVSHYEAQFTLLHLHSVTSAYTTQLQLMGCRFAHCNTPISALCHSPMCAATPIACPPCLGKIPLCFGPSRF